jgi:hypothetical protein
MALEEIQMKDYVVVEASVDRQYEDISGFQDKVNELLNAGYTLAGGVSISASISPCYTFYAQALVRE